MDFLRSLHGYQRLVVPSRAGASGGDGDVRTAVLNLDRFLGSNLGLALSYLCASPEGTDEWVLAFVDGVCDLSIDAAVVRVLEGLLRAICATRRFTLFNEAATRVRCVRTFPHRGCVPTACAHGVFAWSLRLVAPPYT